MYSELQLSAPVSPHSAERYCGCCQEGPQEKAPPQETWLSLKLVPAMKKQKSSCGELTSQQYFVNKVSRQVNWWPQEMLGYSAQGILVIHTCTSPFSASEPVWGSTSHSGSRTITLTKVLKQTQILPTRVQTYCSSTLTLFIIPD